VNLNGAIAAIKAFREATQGKTVSPEEIKRRVAICTACPKRKSNTGIVGNVSRTMGILANKHKVPSDIAKFMCSVCGCNLSLLIPSINGHKDTPEEAAVRKNLTCWMLTESGKGG